MLGPSSNQPKRLYATSTLRVEPASDREYSYRPWICDSTYNQRQFKLPRNRDWVSLDGPGWTSCAPLSFSLRPDPHGSIQGARDSFSRCVTESKPVVPPPAEHATDRADCEHTQQAID
jgi:hypothetical protein